MRLSSLTMRLCLAASVVLATMTSGCVTGPHAVPAGNQPLAQTQVGGIVVSVPRLDSGDFPGDVLDISTAVLVVIENRGTSEIIIDPQGFRLGDGLGNQIGPIAPEQLALREVAPTGLPDGTALAWRGGGGGGRGGGVHFSAPPARSFGGGVSRGSYGGVRVAPSVGYRGGYSPGYRGGYGSAGWRGSYNGPGWRGGSYAPRNYYHGYSRWGFWAGGPLYWGPTSGQYWYGSPGFWPWLYDGPRYYAYSRSDALQMGLPEGRLPPGGRTGGFLYFPRTENSEGMPLVLTWSVRESANQQVIGTAQLNLELHSD
jgi:hypothetical protein